MIQQILIGIIFFAALFYLGRMLYKNFSSKNPGCESCGSCKIDLEKIEKEILSKK